MTELHLEQIRCPLCDAEDSRAVVQSPDNQWGVPGTFSAAECLQCRHVYMNPRPVLSSLGDCYPDNYGPHQNLPTSTEVAAPAEAAADVESVHRPWYLRYLPLKRIPGLKAFYLWLTNDRSQWLPIQVSKQQRSTPPRAFELGCAAGAYLQQLKNSGWQVGGVEPGRLPAQAAMNAGLDVVEGTLDTVPQPEESFDFAASWMVLEHVPFPRTTLTQLFRLLKPGGVLAISIPNAGCWEPRFFGSAWDAWDLPRHLHHFSPSSIRRLLKECGFRNVRVVHQRNVLNVIGSLGIAITRRNPHSRIGQWLLRYPHAPRLWLQLLLTPITFGLAFLRQGGRLTVIADKPGAKSDSDQFEELEA